jgi:hypothetical protein
VHYLVPGHFNGTRRDDVFMIMQRLPQQGHDYQYRIKSDREPHHRVAKESQLERTV